MAYRLLGKQRIFLTLLVIIGFNGSAHAEDPQVKFPANWRVTELPIPSPNGQQIPGSIRRAMLSDQAGIFIAAIELVAEPQPADLGIRDLPGSFSQMEAGAGDVYRKAGLAFSCTSPTPIQVAGTGGLDAQCEADRGSQALVRQRLVMWSKPGMLASLSYSSSAGQFAGHMASFDQSLASIVSR